MVVMRLFAAAREAAGTGRAEFEGLTVSEVLGEARERFGNNFAQVLAASRVWVNGQPAHEDDRVSATDEIAVLPPVSGG